MADNNYTAESINNLTNLLAGTIQAQAMRPQKTSTFTNTTSTNTPYALADMIARRDSIGRTAKELDDVLRARESYAYRLGQGLANVTPQDQSGAGWLSGFLRGVGGGLTGYIDNRAARAQQKYENEMKDLATILAYDKAMGDTTTQKQSQVIGYTPMEYGVDKQNGMTDEKRKQIQESMITSENLGDLYNTVNNYPMVFSKLGSLNQKEWARGLRSGITTEGVTDMGHKEFAYLNSMMPNGFASAINTASEQKIMRPYTTEFESGTGSQKKASIKNMLGGIYDEFARDVRSQGYEMPMTKEQYINERINKGRIRNPDYYIGKSDKMYLDKTERSLPKTRDIKINNETKTEDGWMTLPGGIRIRKK